MLSTVIIDDEIKAIKSLTWELNNFCDNVDILKSFTNPEEALGFLSKNSVDLVFLDVQMPQLNGLEFLKQVKKRDFLVIFTTAYNEFAIEAIKEGAVDYLTKPIDTDDLIESIKKVTHYIENVLTRDVLEESLLSIKGRRIKISVDGKLLFLEINEILYCESDGNYTSMFLADKQKLFITKKLKEIEEILPSTDFFRVHNSYIVNLNKVRAYYKTDAYVEMSNLKKIPVSRKKKSDFLDKV